MKPLAALFGASVLALAAPAFAQENGRIRELTWTPGVVHTIEGAFRTATQIIFSPEETIRHAAIGDSVAWEIAAEGSVLFLKPRERHAPTNLLVVTDRAGETRHYAFALSAGGGAGAVWQVRFRYPSDENAAAEAALTQAAAAAETRLIGLELARGALEGPRNLAWTAQGASALQPSEISDNGRFTVMRFPGGQAIPAIFEMDGATERLVPHDVRGEFVVIHGVVRGLRLRRGASVLCLYNEAFDDRSTGSPTGTSSPQIDRVATGASS